MSKINDGGPAHPTLVFARDGNSKNFREQRWPGLSLRDHFAGQALIALVSRHQVDVPFKNIGATAYEIADAMLAARTNGGADDRNT